MDDLEQCLRLAVVAYVGGGRPAVSCREAAEVISVVLEIPCHCFSVHKFHPEDFLVVFTAADLRNIALAAGSIEHGHFKLFVRPWLRQVIREHEGLERWLCLSNSDGSGQSGLLEDSSGFSGRGEWQVLPWTRGVRDHRSGMQPSGAQGGSYRQALLGCLGPSNWRIPPMVNATQELQRNRDVATPWKEPASSAG
ncbi:hypothetical protein ZWY2020_005995 [Hordeum vulgare]|nr:hypothetical protein ZWY2020_005995 [Hordeum vulgare]